MGLTGVGEVIYRSRIPDLEIPDVSLSEHVLRGATARGGKPALVDALTGEVLSYGQLVEGSAAGAAGLAAADIAAGDVVSLMSHNQPSYAVAVHAVMSAGAVVSPLNPALTVEEAAKQLHHAHARALVVAESAADKGVEALAEADPGAEMLLDLRCPGCRHDWQELFEIAVFFWAELESRARRALLEVHTLAQAYGWREAEILAMSPRRRQTYLELLGA